MKSLTRIAGMLFVVLALLHANLFAQQQRGGPPRGDKSKPQERRPPTRDIEDLKRELGEEWEKTILEKVKAEEPEEIEPLRQEKLKNPARYEEQLAKLWNDLGRLERLKQENPARYNNLKKQLQLERDCRKLAQQHRKSNDATQRAQMRADLKSCLTELFTLREAERAEKVAELEQELAELREMLAFRAKNKDTIIEKRLKEMIGEGEKLEW
ncbi:MAG: hypothetical protein DKINENOH_00844 [bacterium]|nr:hypothetical protein [bacterium]